MNPNTLILPFALGCLALLAGCASGPEPRYEGPRGEGRLLYDPGRGIVRAGAVVSSDEQSVFSAVEKAFQEGRWLECIAQSELLTATFPEGSRAVDAILMRVQARLSAARAEDEGVPETISLMDWFFLYLAPDDDPRLTSLLARGGQTAETTRDLRSRDFERFIQGVKPEATALYKAGQLDRAAEDCVTLVTYYLPAQELRQYRARSAELARTVAWLVFASEGYNLAIELCEDIRTMNPAPSVKADALFVLGQSQRANGGHALAAQTFDMLYRGAGLRDTDTRWRPWALYWMTRETMASSKGWVYDLSPYEVALELVGEYELYLLENPGVPVGLHQKFLQTVEELYNVMVRREQNSALTYDLLGEDKARDYCLQRATDWEDKRDERIENLRSAP